MDKSINEIFDTLNQEQRESIHYLVGHAVETGKNYIAGNGYFDNSKQRSLRKFYNDLNKEQKITVDYPN